MSIEQWHHLHEMIYFFGCYKKKTITTTKGSSGEHFLTLADAVMCNKESPDFIKTASRQHEPTVVLSNRSRAPPGQCSHMATPMSHVKLQCKISTITPLRSELVPKKDYKTQPREISFIGENVVANVDAFTFFFLISVKRSSSVFSMALTLASV